MHSSILGGPARLSARDFHEMVSVKNRWLSRGGVSPTQLVFGKMPRIPGDLPSDDHAGLMALHDALEDPLGTDQAATEFRRRMAWRCAKGRQATMAQASREAVQRAVKVSTNPGSSTPVSGCLFFGEVDRETHYILEIAGLGQDWLLWPTTAPCTSGCEPDCGDVLPSNFGSHIRRRRWGYQLASDPRMSELIRRVISGSTAGASSEAGVSEPAGGPPSRDLEPSRNNSGSIRASPHLLRSRPGKSRGSRNLPAYVPPGTPTEYMLRALQKRRTCASVITLVIVFADSRRGSDWRASCGKTSKRMGGSDQLEGPGTKLHLGKPLDELWTSFEHSTTTPKDLRDLGIDSSGNWSWLAKRNDEVSLKQLAKDERECLASPTSWSGKSILGSKAVRVLVGKHGPSIHPGFCLAGWCAERNQCRVWGGGRQRADRRLREGAAFPEDSKQYLGH